MVKYKVYLVEETNGNGNKIYYLKVDFIERGGDYLYLSTVETLIPFRSDGQLGQYIDKFNYSSVESKQVSLKRAIFHYLDKIIINTKEDEIIL